ncbi:helix-turn-helix domain-containing protein, partial [Bifidobacterium longum]|uniref:helix-turn-helix domain-containing protein n=1 Tax=Bifidobacterium longum TaxID=216816 RepID=UPI001F1BC57B
ALTSAKRPTASLSKREQDVLRLYAANLSTEENAAKLGIKASTIFVVMKHAKAKLGVATRSEAIRAYLTANQAGCVCTLDIPVYAHDRVGQIVGDPVVQGSGDVITLGLAALPFEAPCPVGLPARVSPVRLMSPLSHCWPQLILGQKSVGLPRCFRKRETCRSRLCRHHDV